MPVTHVASRRASRSPGLSGSRSKSLTIVKSYDDFSSRKLGKPACIELNPGRLVPAEKQEWALTPHASKPRVLRIPKGAGKSRQDLSCKKKKRYMDQRGASIMSIHLKPNSKKNEERSKTTARGIGGKQGSIVHRQPLEAEEFQITVK
ncbi:hypothetical protein B0H11DRAFT_1898168 [Mycena galericulata]|nr:hypothetical protein B0H11DRAFT_1898168 [Mycena galericulata]